MNFLKQVDGQWIENVEKLEEIARFSELMPEKSQVRKNIDFVKAALKSRDFSTIGIERMIYQLKMCSLMVLYQKSRIKVGDGFFKRLKRAIDEFITDLERVNQQEKRKSDLINKLINSFKNYLNAFIIISYRDPRYAQNNR